MALSNGGFTISFAAYLREFQTALGSGQNASEFEHYFNYSGRYEPGDGQYRVNAAYGAYSAALSSTDLDLRGTLLNLADRSQNVTFPIVMGIFVKNHSKTDGEYITVGGATNPFITWLAGSGDGVRVQPDGFLALWSPRAGYATTASTADILTLAPATGNPACSYLIVGRSA
jgi:hypothetical protein